MRKPIKKLISIILCIGLMVSMSQFSFVFANDEQAIEQDYEDAILAKDFLVAAGAKVSLNTVMFAPATRGDFLTCLMSLMNLISPGGAQSCFADIAPGTALYNASGFAVATGIVSPAENFYPENQVTYPQAAKMCVEALGIGKKAVAMGGYPYGYLRLASESDLNDGLSGNEEMTIADMYIMLANLCEANVYSVTSYDYSNGVINHNFKESKPFMEAYLNICKTEGVVDGANGGYLYDNSTSFDKGCVSVDDVVYNLADGVECSLGLNVHAYYKNDNKVRKEIIFVRPWENKVVSISAENCPEIVDGKLSYINEDSGKEYRLSIDSLYSVIYNGRYDGSFKDSDFSIDSGYIEAIDNNGDNKFDVFSVWKADYLEVGVVNPYDGIIYDANYKTNILLSEEDIICFSDKAIDEYSNGECLEVYISKDGKLIKINTVNNEITGNVTAFGTNDEIYVDDVKYTTHSYFEEFYRKNVAFGSAVTFVVNDEGMIVSVKSLSKADFLFAYLDEIKQTSGLSSKVLIRLYSQNDEVIETELLPKIRYNGKSADSADVFATLETLEGTIIKYQSDEENIVTAINTMSDEEGIFDPIFDGYNAVKRYRFQGDDTDTQISYKSFGYFVPYFTIDVTTTIFCVSPDKTLSDEERFSIAKSLTFLDNDEKVPSNSLKPYNVYDTGHASVLLYEAAVGAEVNVDNAPCGIVAECSLALDNQGDEAYKVVLYQGDSYFVKFVKPDSSFIHEMNLAEGEMPFNTGDVIRYSQSGDYIEGATKDFDGKTRTLLNTTGDNRMVHYYYGKLYAVGSSSIAILRDDGSIVYVPTSISSVCMVDENDVYTAPKDVIATYKQAGDKATKILVKCRYSAVAQVYTFK